MNAALEAFGLGADDLCSQAGADYPPRMPGRVAHIDADFLAYQVSAETKDELDGIKPRKDLEEMQHNALNAAEHLMRLVGGSTYVMHVTPSGSDKGKRGEQAIQQEYQASRQERVKPEHLDAIRAFIGTHANGAIHLEREADDGMAQANYNAADRSLSVIVSKDKDLRMVPGLHWCFDTEQIVDVSDAFGSIWIDDSTTSKTLKGWGTKFFWAQCLMGDAADYIKGLPAVPGAVCCEIAPTSTYLKAAKMVEKAGNAEVAAGPRRLMDEQEARTKPCGAVLTYALLEHVTTDLEAFALVKRCWVDLAEKHGYEFRHWRTDVPVTPTQALLGDMQLLWMRRNDDPLDVVQWLKERRNEVHV